MSSGLTLPGGLWACPLDEDDANWLARHMREADKQDSLRLEFEPLEALIQAMNLGPTWGIWEIGDGVDTLLGAGGWNPLEGTIWSLWTELTPEQARKVMLASVPAIRALVAMAGRTLTNFVWEGNQAIISWLKATHCFQFDSTPVNVRGKVFHRFHTRPLAELLNV